MKKLQIGGLLAVAVAALIAFAATASASTTLTSPKGTAYFGTLHANTENHALLAPPNLTPIECNSTAEGEVTANGTPATITSKVLTFGSPSCTNNWHVTTVAPGSLTIESGGTIKSNALTVEATRFGVVCRYKTENTVIGLMTDSAKTGETATMHVSGAVPFHSGSALCGTETTKWSGSYKIDTPD